MSCYIELDRLAVMGNDNKSDALLKLKTLESYIYKAIGHEDTYSFDFF